MNKARILIFFFFAFMVCVFESTAMSGSSHADSLEVVETPAPTVPQSAVLRDSTFKVGLVLSGGGAQGIAHAGVIKALEENDIPVNCIAGTSMGAIVGSLYACGYSPEEMLELFTSPEFRYWSTGTVNKDLTYYFSSPQPSPQWLSINLNLKDSVNNISSQIIPANLISPIPMNLEFLRLYAPFTQQCGSDFNDLFVPLRTVCSDVYHKRKIVCYKGSLGDAVRASMSFPLVFKPIELDGVLVYDGGIYDNFPVDVMQTDFNPDFIIGVSVSGPDTKPEAGNIYSQLEDMIIQNNDYSVPDSAGIKIQVPVLQFGVLDFDKADIIYDIGYRTGLSMVDSIRRRCKSRMSLDKLEQRRREFRSRTPRLHFDSVAVEGADARQARYLVNLFEGGLRNARMHKSFGMGQVSEAYYRAITDGKLNDLLPQAIFGADGHNTLLLKANIKNPWEIGVGGWISSSTQSMLYATLGFHTLSLNSLDIDLSGWLGQSYYAGMVSGKIMLPTALPSSLQLMAVWSRQKYFKSEVLFYENSIPSSASCTEGFLRIVYALAAGRSGKVSAMASVGIMRDYYHTYGAVVNDESARNRADTRAAALQASYEKNTLDNQLYPMTGSLLHTGLGAILEGSKRRPVGGCPDSKAYHPHWAVSAYASWKRFFSLHECFHIGASAQAMLSARPLYRDYTETLLHSAAFAPTPSTLNYFNPAFRSDNYLAAGILPIWNPVGKLQLRGDFYVYAPVRDIRNDNGMAAYGNWFRRVEFMGEAAAVYNFSFASLSIYCNYLSSPARNWNFGISFGLLFQAPKFYAH